VRLCAPLRVAMVKVAVKWAKETYNVEVDPQEPGLVFKHQLFSLTGVPPERQKIMVKGGMLKDDADVAKLGLKEGQKLMMMGSADKARPASGPAIKLAVRGLCCAGLLRYHLSICTDIYFCVRKAAPMVAAQVLGAGLSRLQSMQRPQSR